MRYHLLYQEDHRATVTSEVVCGDCLERCLGHLTTEIGSVLVQASKSDEGCAVCISLGEEVKV